MPDPEDPAERPPKAPRRASPQSELRTARAKLRALGRRAPPSERAKAHLELAMALRTLGRYRDADATLGDARSQLTPAPTEPPDSRIAAEIALERARVLWQTGDHEGARAEGVLARERFQALNDELGEAEVDLVLAEILHHDLDARDVDSALERAHAIFERQGEEWLAARADTVLANRQAQAGEMPEAAIRYERASEIFEHLDDIGAVATCQANLATIHLLRGELQRAVRRATRARDEYRRLGMLTYAALTELNLCQLLLDLNRNDEALQLARSAREQLAAEGLAYDNAILAINLGRALARTGDAAEARRVLGDAASVFRESGASLWEAQVDVDVAAIDLAGGHWKQAQERAAQARAVLDEAGTPLYAAYALLVEARAAEEIDPAESLTLHRRALALGEATHITWLSYRAHHRIALLLDAAGHPTAARRHADQALRLIEDSRLALAGDLAKTAFLEDKGEAFETAVRLHLSADDPSAALRAAESAKSSALADLVAASGESVAPAAALPEDVAADWRALETTRKEYFALASGLAASDESGVPSAPGPEGALMRAAVRTQTLAEQYERLRDRLQAKGRGDLIDLHSASPMTASEIAALLGPNDLFLDLFAHDQELSAFLIDPSGGVKVESIGDWNKIRHLLHDDWNREIGEMASLGPDLRRTLAPSLLASAERCLASLGDLLLAPFANEIGAARTLFIAPHGPLHAAPFPALLLDGAPLATHIETAIVPSASVLRSLAARGRGASPGAPPLICAVADEDAPAFEHEAREVKLLLGEDAQLLEGASATPARLLAGARDASHLHIACHGEFDGASPMASALSLAGGKLTAADLYRARIAGPLVVLSGCETGRSRVRPGDELLGLLRGILFAGAGAVVASLWRVDDRAAADLMGALYRHLKSGAPAAAALRHAQLEIRERRPHPYDWASFEVFGRGDITLAVSPPDEDEEGEG
ncbi:MAG: hypothetical protein CME06_12825 [Gemmatimonadetes bacterium]|nr:hypothetical protein [Gemmatimonadota bacterium]